MSWRRFGVILRGLPIESEYKTAVRNGIDLSDLPPPEPGVYGPWPQTDMLLARIGDRLSDWLWMNADPKTRPAQPPPPHPRPGVDHSNVTAISPAALAYLEYVRENHGAAPPDDWKPALA